MSPATGRAPVEPAARTGTETPYRAPDLTNGFLPGGAFLHDDPTAVVVRDIESPEGLVTPDGREPPEGHRDALVLVRQGRRNLGLLHVDWPIELGVDEELDRVIREQFGFAGGNGSAQPASRTIADAAVVVPTANRERVLERCIRYLLAMTVRPAEIIIVDNSPAQGNTASVVAKFSDPDVAIRYVAEPRPGSSLARNRGIAETRRPLIGFTDDDVVVDPGWLEGLLAPFADPQVQAVTGLVLPLELETPAQKLFERYAGFGKGFERRRYDMRDNRAPNRFMYPYWGGVFGSGNSVAFRRRELIERGGFSPALGAGSPARGGADTDAMTHAVLAGTLAYEPSSLCWHAHRRDEQGFSRQLFGYGAGLTATFMKWAMRDPRFMLAVAQSVPVLIERRRAVAESPIKEAALPSHLAKVERRGMLWGPALYLWSVGRSRLLGHHRVIGKP